MTRTAAWLRHFALGALLASGAAAAAGAPCRQALVLGLDVSGSVDTREYRLQVDGLAGALQHPDVVEALLARPDALVHLAVFEWSAPSHQRVLVPWREIRAEGDIAAIAALLRGAERVAAPPLTGLGSAMERARAMMAERAACERRVVDISGDGQNNAGPRPHEMRAALSADGITLNALVIGADTLEATDRRAEQIGELVAYFGANVITGPDAFVQAALGFEDYEAAMVTKLLRELRTLVLSESGAADDAPRTLARLVRQ